MNQNEIDKLLDDMIAEDAKKIDAVFAQRLKEINQQIAALYAKYSIDGKLSMADLNKYNRFKKEMERMTEESSKAFKTVIIIVEALAAKQFLENYMRSAYLYEIEAAVKMGYTLPTTAMIQQAILNPIAELTLSALYKRHRDDYVRQIQISIAQGIQAGEDYSKIAKRIERSTEFARKKARDVARTETHRVQVLGRMKSAEQASKHANLEKTWNSTLDLKTRLGHRKLDGKTAKNGLFVSIYGGVGPAPGHMNNAKDDINCRCTVSFKVNGKMPDTRRARKGGSGAGEVIPYQTYEEWYKTIERKGK
ncbi:phage minor head protein [Bacillus safensis]|uniref:phage minor head protein n=1 Tax=Bacillus safensis TaxID=561879 RepID=UPI00054CEFCC|nr:phage minor head protein [Bacillus safensis]AWI35729.1 phage head morphogenesis protein [Bacillus safensis FO-36b]MCM3050261.1 phage head morphogenesis protein [Bacillus safensis]MEC1048591.1 phage minor head protein [Bacillus safensis]